MQESITETIQHICKGRHLTRSASKSVFNQIVRGELDDVKMSALLVALKAKGETSDEIAGAAEALRESSEIFHTGGLDLADTCGTGGDGAHTVNISTAAALVVAQAGVLVAKHGNRAISSRCGSADVLEKCGVKIDADPALAYRALKEIGICFLFAPQYHAGMRHAMSVRKQLGMRTMFNLLGPLANPARPRWQVVGVYDPCLCDLVAQTLGKLGCESALVVHGAGIDEIGLHAATQAALWRGGKTITMEINPKDLGLESAALEDLAGGSATDNAAWLEKLLSGRADRIHKQAVAINAGALLWISGRSADLRQGVAKALDIIESGSAADRLRRWVEISHGA